MASWRTYRDLTGERWSFRTGNGRVAHAERLLVINPRFVVQPAHAFAQSDTAPVVIDRDIRTGDGWIKVTYDPHRDTTFVEDSAGRPRVASAAIAVCDRNGRLYVEGPVYA